MFKKIPRIFQESLLSILLFNILFKLVCEMFEISNDHFGINVLAYIIFLPCFFLMMYHFYDIKNKKSYIITFIATAIIFCANVLF